MSPVSPWVEFVVALLLVASGLVSLIASWGLIRLPDFFRRMHPPALITTLGAWFACGATVIYLSALGGQLDLHAWLVVVLLAMTVPITAVLLARAALLRKRAAGSPGVPPPLDPLDVPAEEPAGEDETPEPIPDASPARRP